jgi:hypothetical protein
MERTGNAPFAVEFADVAQVDEGHLAAAVKPDCVGRQQRLDFAFGRRNHIFHMKGNVLRHRGSPAGRNVAERRSRSSPQQDHRKRR